MILRPASHLLTRPALAALFLILLSACATGPPRPPSVGPVRDPLELLRLIAARTEGLRDVEMRARMSIRIEGIRQNASALLFYRAPGTLKFDITGPLGVGVLSARAYDDSLSVYLPRENRHLAGPPDDVLYRITGVNLEYYEARRAILGLPGLSPLDLPRVQRFDTLDERQILEIATPLWTRRVWVDRRTAVVLEERIYSPQGQLLSGRLMDDYRDENGVILPRRIEIFQGDDRIRIDITARKINAGLSDDRFRFRIPSDVIRLDKIVH